MKKKNKIIFVLCMLPVLLVSMLVPCFAHTVKIDGKNYDVDPFIVDKNIYYNENVKDNTLRVNYKGVGLDTAYRSFDGPFYIYTSTSDKELTSALDITSGLNADRYMSSVNYDISFIHNYFYSPTMPVSADASVSLSSQEPLEISEIKDFLKGYRIYAVCGTKQIELIRFVEEYNNSLHIAVQEKYCTGSYNDETTIADYIILSDTDLEIFIHQMVHSNLGIVSIDVTIESQSGEWHRSQTLSFEIPLAELRGGTNINIISCRSQISRTTVFPENLCMKVNNYGVYHYLYGEVSYEDIAKIYADFYEKGKTDGTIPLQEALDKLQKDYNVLANSKGNSDAIPKLFDGVYATVKRVFGDFMEYEAFGIPVSAVVGIVLGAVVIIVGGKLILSLIG